MWNEEVLSELERLTLCASWRVVMVKVEGWVVEAEEETTPLVRVVDTTTDKVCGVKGQISWNPHTLVTFPHPHTLQDIDVAEELVSAGLCEWTRLALVPWLPWLP